MALAASLPAAALTPAASGSLAEVVAGPQRSVANKARDAYRHPVETLAFFGLQPTMTVVEISPQGGWYTEILAPYLRDHGKLEAAADNPALGPRAAAARAKFEAKLAANPASFGKVEVTAFGKDAFAIAPDGSADMVLTFRNVHNWYIGGFAPDAFKAFYAALKPGGVLGVEHEDLNRDQARRGGGLQAGGPVRDQRQSEGQGRLPRRRLDAAADLRSRCCRPCEICRDRRVGPDDVALREVSCAANPARLCRGRRQNRMRLA